MTRYSLDLSFEEFKESLSPDDLLTTVPGLYFSPRSGRVLIVEPESASWLVVSQNELGLLVERGLLAPGSVTRASQKLTDLQAGLGPELLIELERWLYRLFIRNMLAINGYGYHQPTRLWSVQKYPHYFNLHLTESCNLSCRYCRVGDSPAASSMMPVDICQKIIRRVIEEIPGTKIIIGFHGGEPLLNPECLVEGSKYAREVARSAGKEITLSLQTNGILLQKYSQLLKELNVEIGVSLDGPAVIHDRHRVFSSGRGSFDRVMAGIQAARQAGLNPGYLAVIHDPNDYLSVAGFMVETLGATSFRLNFSCYEGRAKSELDFDPGRAAAFARNWLQLVDFVLEHHRRTGVWLSIDDLNLFVAHLLTRDRPHMCYRSPCGAGNAILGFGSDGKIYPCEELVGKEQFCLGDINAASTLDRLLDESQALARVSESRKVENVAHCASCPWRRFHGAGCLNKSFEYFGDLEHGDPMCHFYRVVFEELMWRLADNPELINLISYYKKYIRVQNEWPT
ncbi:MAG: radical SAM protein [Candidatus Saccharicenans sp.]|nr:radical SAM protein [Candidatus Saccharicenans sp.]